MAFVGVLPESGRIPKRCENATSKGGEKGKDFRCLSRSMSIVLLPPRRSLSHPTPAEAKLRRPHRFVNNNRNKKETRQKN